MKKLRLAIFWRKNIQKKALMYEKYTLELESSCEIWLPNWKNCQGKSVAREVPATAAAL